MLAILQALKGRQVFVVTSNSVLAKRDAQKSSKLFQLFNITVGHNQDSKIYIRGPKDCYTKNVVFGDASQFQFDILRDEYSCLGTLAGCKLDVMIVDEVDSMFIDDSSKLARLASLLPGMDQLEFIYHFIWEKLNQVQSSVFRVDERQFLAFGKLQLDNSGLLSIDLADDEGNIFNIPDLHNHIRSGGNITGVCREIEGDILLGISSHLNNLLQVLLTKVEKNGYEMKDENKMKIPKHLQSFVEKQIPRWVENALTAFYYTENVHYIVHEGSIKPVDFETTGVVQSSTSWSDGLHQFLQIKHNLVVTPETLATNYLSNVGFFKRFKKEKLFGFTGTFGSEAAKETISALYNVDLVLIPNSNHKRYFQYQDKIVNSNKEWLVAIKHSVNLEVKKNRAVLIICRTILDAETIHKDLSSCAKRSNSVKLYTKNLRNEDKHVERVVAGEVIVATNLAGRGTDIKTEKTIEDNGGLHVIMTFLPATQRAEDQAIGRTSRINNVGTSQFILLNSNSVESMYREKRDENEKKILDEFRKNEMKVISLKDELFNKFCQLLKDVRAKLDLQKPAFQKLRKSLLSQTVESVYDKNILGAIEEQWALFVSTIESEPLKRLDDQQSVRIRYYDFENKIRRIFDRGLDQYMCVIESPYYAISIGNDLINNEYSIDAMKYFDYAIEKDESFSAAAYLGKAWCLVQPKTKFWYFNDQHVSNYKNEAIKALSQSMKLLETEKVYLNAMHVYAVKRSDETDLTKQLLEKSSILGNYMSSIEAAIRQVKTTQRLVDITFSRKYYNNYLMHNDLIISEEHKQVERKPLEESHIPKFAEEYNIDLSFHNLTVRYDTKVKTDQAEKLIDSFVWECPMQLRLTEMNANLYSTFLSPDIECNTRISKTDVVEMLNKNSRWISSILAKLPLTPMKRQILKFDAKLIKEDGVLLESFCGLSEEAFKEKVDGADESTFFTFKIKDSNREVRETVKNALFDISLSNVSKESAVDLFQACKAELVSLKIVGKTADLIEFCNHPLIPRKRILLHVVKDNGKVETTEMLMENIDSLQEDISCVEIKMSAVLAHKLFNNVGRLNLLFDVLFKDINLELTQKILKLHKGAVSLVIITKTKELTKKVIPLLRERNIEFALQLLNLDFVMANNLLQSDCIQEEDVKVQSSKRLPTLYLHDHNPRDIHNFMARGIEYLLIFDEKGFVPWYAVASVCFLGALQISVGGILIATGLGAPFGMALLTEDSVDLMVSYRAFSNRNFSWRDYCLQKSVSVLISFATFGVPAIKNAGSGINSLIQGVRTEAAEQGTVQLILHGKEITTAAAGYGKSLFSLAFKQAGISVAEAAARESLLQLSGTVSNTIFQNFESDIESSISRTLKLVSAQTPLLDLLTRICVFEKCINRKGRITNIISNFLEEIVSPENSFWKTQWNSIGMMICQGIASSSSQALNNPIMLGGRLSTMLWGSIEIANMEKNLCEQIVVKLQKHEKSKFSLLRVVELICNFSIGDAGIFTNVISSSSRNGSPSTFYEYLMSDEYRSLDSKQVSEFRSISDCETVSPAKARFSKCTKEILESLQSKQKLDAFDLHSEMLALIVKAATQQIVHISQSQLITPVSTFAIGHFVRKVSNYVQAAYIVSEAENSDSQNQNFKKYNELVTRLSKGETLSDKEQTFIDKFKSSRCNLTVENQIYHNASDLHLANNLQEIGRSLTNVKVEKLKNLDAAKYAQSVRSGKKAGLTEIVHLMQVHDVNLVITDNHKDVEQLVKQSKNRPILFFSYEKEYELYDSSGNLINISDKKGSKDQGYKILEHLTNKKEGELRNIMASDILSHGESLLVKIEAEQMLHRYGGGSRPSAQERPSNSLKFTKIMHGVEQLVKKIPSSKAKKVPSNSNRNTSQNIVPGVSVNNNNTICHNVSNNNQDIGTSIALEGIAVLPSFFAYIICNIVVLQNIVAICTFYIICCHYYGRHGNPDNDVD